MIGKWQWIRMLLAQRLWVRAAAFALLGVVLAVAALYADRIIAEEWVTSVSEDAARSILTILASSMLAVTTFSLSVMVTALGGASDVSPRATTLLIEDNTAQNVLAIFIGAFLFSLAGLILLNLGFYNAQSELALFFVSIFMVVCVVIAILMWIDHLTFFGRMGDTVDRVEKVTINALTARLANPCLGGHPLFDTSSIPESATGVCCSAIGYVEFLDTKSLQEFASKRNIYLYIEAIPGSFVHHSSPLFYVVEPLSDHEKDTLIASFHIGHGRHYLQDPRFGLSVMAEIACRGLSSAINDTGTPIDIIGRSLRIFSVIAERILPEEAEILYEHLYIPPMVLGDLFDDFFQPVARDSASIIEVQIRLHKALLALEAFGDKAINVEVKRHQQIALDYAQQKLLLPEEFVRLSSLVMASRPSLR